MNEVIPERTLEGISEGIHEKVRLKFLEEFRKKTQ